MKVYPYFNQSRMKDGQYPIYVVVSRPPKRFYIFSGLYSTKIFEGNIFPRSEKNSAAKTSRLTAILDGIEAIVLDNPRMTDRELKELISEKVLNKEVSSKGLMYYMDKYTKERVVKISSKRSFYNTINKVRAYKGEVSMESINVDWLDKFRTHLLGLGLCDNSVVCHLRNIRVIFNWCIDNDITANYPFRKYKFKKVETRKRSLSVETLRELFSYPVRPCQVKYVDIFKLVFMLIGINGVDLLNAKPEDVVDGRLNYRRAKTSKLYSVKIEPEAMEIINKYRGKEYLLCFGDYINDYTSFMSNMNRSLHKIGEWEKGSRGAPKFVRNVIPPISLYWARHSWATIASELDIPRDTIAAGLGHSMGNPTTAIYINFNMKKVDEANRKIIDYVLYDKREDKAPLP